MKCLIELSPGLQLQHRDSKRKLAFFIRDKRSAAIQGSYMVSVRS